MRLPHRRQFLHLAAVAAALPAVSRIAWAQTYPSRPVRLIVGAPAGGATDILARLLSQWLSERLGQSFVVENRSGAAGNLATEAVVRATADGYTLLVASAANAVNATLYSNLSFNFIHDIAPVAGLVRVPLVIEVNTSILIRTIPELIASAKANAGVLNYATGGNGTAAHLAAELFKMMTGANLTHVPYRRGGPALTDLLGGQVQAMFSPLPESIETIRANRVRALAVTTAQRSEVLPDVPTVAESVPGYEASTWFGVGAPKNTSPEVLDKLNKDINTALADPKMKARFADLGGMTIPGPPAQFGALVAEETEKWGKVVKSAGIKAS